MRVCLCGLCVRGEGRERDKEMAERKEVSDDIHSPSSSSSSSGSMTESICSDSSDSVATTIPVFSDHDDDDGCENEGMGERQNAMIWCP